MDDKNQYANTQPETGIPSHPTAQYMEHMFSTEGWGTKLLTRIGRVKLFSARHGVAFRSFAEHFIQGETFCIADLILASETGTSRRVRAGAVGDGIYLLQNAPSMEKSLLDVLMASSVPGLCGLLAVSPGAELAVPAACDLATFVRSRFFLLREKDAAAIDRATAQMGGARLERVGTILPDLVTFLEGRTVLWQRRREDLVPHAVVCIEVGDDCDSFFRDGVQAALTYYAFADLKIRTNLFFHFPEELTLPQLLTAELAIFDALSVYPVYAQPVRFAPGGTVSLVVPRIYPYAGDRVMALRPKTDENHILLPEELKKLRKYLASAMESGIIKGVLPLKKNTPAMLKKLSGDSLVFTAEKDLPAGFAVLAVVPQNAEVPGIPIGTFLPKYD